jgi:hypothetical protein
VFLHTDASDYGIGAYLFQMVDGDERPVALFSKSLVKEQLRWSVPEKECFAIVAALEKFRHLIQHVRFILRTDHKNLTYINLGGSPKVYRWKLAIQEYDFDIEYIKGADNIVADGMSRFCPVSVDDDDDADGDLVCILGKFEIPDDKRTLIAKVHNSKAGHHGVDRTYAKLVQAQHHWPHMREHVRRFIRYCPCCQKMSQIKVPILTHPFVTSTYTPFERINVDTVGPLPKDDYGNEFVVVIRDTFTRFVGLYISPSTESAICGLTGLSISNPVG